MSRLRHGKGFGIHSPFAYSFIRNVLCEKKCGLYCYPELQRYHRWAKKLLPPSPVHPVLLSIDTSRRLARIASYFNPSCFLIMGVKQGLSTASLLAVAKTSRAVVYPGTGCNYGAFNQITSELGQRITVADTPANALAQYRKAGSRPFFLLINSTSADTDASIRTAVAECIAAHGIIIMRHLRSSKAMARIWRDTLHDMPHGMSFTNGRLGVIVADAKLPKQSFDVWFY